MHQCSLRLTWPVALACGWLTLSGSARSAMSTNASPPRQVAEPVLVLDQFRSSLTNERASNTLPDDDTRIAARDPVVVKFHEAVAVMLAGDYAKSIPLLESVIQVRPSLINAWEALCACYVKVGRTDDAEHLMEHLLTIDPTLPRIHRVLGQLATMQGELSKAEDLYRASLKLEPAQYETRLELAGILRRQNRIEEAIALLRQLWREDPKRNDVALKLARVLLDNQQYEESMPFWIQISALDPKNEQYLTTVARVQLDVGQATNALETASKVLAMNAANLAALAIMADLKEYGNQPAEALPYLKKIIENADTSMLAQQTRIRFIVLSVHLHSLAPLKYSLDDSILQAEDFLDLEPDNVEIRLLLAELYGMNRNYLAAEKLFRSVLSKDNPHNRRAHNGLFELYAAQIKFKEAEQELKQVESFNPLDPYLHYTRAQFASAQGDYGKAYRELDLLEAAGRGGAVAALLYHGLTMTEWSQTTSVKRFREQLAAFQQAGFRFITPDQLPDYFANRTNMLAPTKAVADLPPVYSADQTNTFIPTNGVVKLPHDSPERVIMITFDDSRRDAMRLGSDVAREFKTVFAMHVPVGRVEGGDPFICTWDLIKQYEAAGGWQFGSHMLDAHESQRLEGSNAVVHPACNRLWLPAQNRMETEGEFCTRIQDEYRRSREIMEQKLGHPITFISYPMGDIGQETRSDLPKAIETNLREAASNYKVGFIQNDFSYAVKGDNPLLYKRHEFSQGVTGAEAVETILRNHPVFLARRLRAEYAAQEGKIYKAKKSLAQLQRDGYPTNVYPEVAGYVRERLTAARTPPRGVDKVTKGPFHLELKDPYVGARGEFFKDNLESRIWRIQGLGGVSLTPNLAVEGRAGVGLMQQPSSFTNAPNIGGPDIKLNERSVGVAPSIKFPNGWILLGEIGARQLSGDVPTDIDGNTVRYDKTFLQYAMEAQIKPFLPMDLNARLEGDVVPAASAAFKGTTYQAGMLNLNYSLFDWWDINGSGARYMFSDSNTRSHLGAGTRWLVYDPLRLHLGLRYDYATSDEANPDYWTPYQLNRYCAEASFRRTYHQIYYNLGIRYGVGKQALRPEAYETYQAGLEQLRQSIQTAIRNKWSPATYYKLVDYYNSELANPPQEPSWGPVLDLVAAARVKLGKGKHWELNGEISYNNVPDYKAINLLGGIKYSF